MKLAESWNYGDFSRQGEASTYCRRRLRIGATCEAGLFAADADEEFTGLDDALAFIVNDSHLLAGERE